MDHAAIQYEKRLRTLRDRIEHEVGREGHTNCIALYFIDRALDAVECDTAAEVAIEMDLPPETPRKGWGCTKCGSKVCRPDK
ncbi:MAG: hypothetical protein LLG45_13245 [Actinomycetia bacterium]|nr:hypothetical protein [Actinomycetes bacterium]